jgi:putative transcriptional regulator
MEPAKIREIRESLGLTQTEFGNILHAHWSTVSNWERGVSEPAPFQQKLLEHFDTVARQKRIQKNIRAALGFGVAFALALLLEHLATKPRRKGRKT